MDRDSLSNAHEPDRRPRATPTFSTRDISASRRFEVFEAEVLAKTYGVSSDIDADARDNFFAELFVHPVADAMAVEEHSSAYHVARRECLVSSARHEAEGETVFCLLVTDVTGQTLRLLHAAIVESTDDAVISFDQNGRISTWNRGAEALFKYTAGEAIGADASLLVAPLGRVIEGESPRGAFDAALSGRVFRADTQRVARDGSVIDVSVTASPVRAQDGAITGVSAIMRDIRPRKRRERLGAEHNRLLEMIATGASAQQCLTALTDAVSFVHPKVRAAVLIANDARDKMATVFAARIGSEFGPGIVGLPIDGTPIGTCGSAIFDGRPIGCVDIARDQTFSTSWREHCLAHGARACLSTPVFGSAGKSIASFLMLFDEPHQADAWDLEIGTFGAHAAGIVLERDNVIAARKAAEEALLQRNRQLELLASASNTLLLASGDEQEILETVFRSIADLLGAELFYHYRPSSDFEGLELVLAMGVGGEERRLFGRMKFGASLCGRVAQSRRRLIVEDLQRSLEPGSEALRGAGGASYAGFPLSAGSGLLGTVAFVSKRLTHFRDGEIRTIQSICDQVASTLERNRLMRSLQEAKGRLTMALDAGRAGIWESKPATGEFAATDAALKLFGLPRWRPLSHEDAMAAVHPDDRPVVQAAVARTLETGEPFSVDLRCIRPRDQVLWLHSQAELKRDGDEKRLIGLVQDITERKEAEERERMLMQEVNHRAKNMLGLVQAIARQTAAGSPEDFADRFEERVQALAASQDVLVQSKWREVPIESLIRSQLGHFADSIGPRVHLSGPQLAVTAAAAQSIGMAMHELATNAAKYGALSNETGRVEISWAVIVDDAGRSFDLSWTETGGPSVRPPARRGFGSRVTGDFVRISCNGKVETDYAAEGFRWRLRCPVDKVIDGESAARFRMAPPPVKEASLCRKRIMVVEDEAVIAEQICELLEQAGFDVLGPVNSVAEALELLDHGGANAAVLDVTLGQETSEPVARRLLASSIPFVTCSGYSRSQLPGA